MHTVIPDHPPRFVQGDITLYTGDAARLTATMPSERVDLTVTSPPYDALRSYHSEADWTWSTFQQVAANLFRITKPGGVVVWIVGDQTSNGSESGSSFRQALFFMAAGFNLLDTMIYKKSNPGGARGSNKAYLHCFEYMFVFSKGPHKTYNLLSDRLNKRSGSTALGGGQRRSSGEMRPMKPITNAATGRRLNLWEYCTKTDRYSKQHPAPFPLALAEDHIISWSNPGELVFDPFSGSGTTVTAALMHGRRAIGIDISDRYHDVAVRRLADLASDQTTQSLLGLNALPPPDPPAMTTAPAPSPPC